MCQTLDRCCQTFWDFVQPPPNESPKTLGQLSYVSGNQASDTTSLKLQVYIVHLVTECVNIFKIKWTGFGKFASKCKDLVPKAPEGTI